MTNNLNPNQLPDENLDQQPSDGELPDPQQLLKGLYAALNVDSPDELAEAIARMGIEPGEQSLEGILIPSDKEEESTDIQTFTNLQQEIHQIFKDELFNGQIDKKLLKHFLRDISNHYPYSITSSKELMFYLSKVSPTDLEVILKSIEVTEEHIHTELLELGDFNVYSQALSVASLMSFFILPSLLLRFHISPDNAIVAKGWDTILICAVVSAALMTYAFYRLEVNEKEDLENNLVENLYQFQRAKNQIEEVKQEYFKEQ